MARVEFRNITKVFAPDVVAVKNFNLEIKDKEFCVLVGPSGCGKTTVLRMVAGLEKVTSGEIIIDDKIINNVPPKDRNIAMVFQNYALYPHMKVYDNMAFGLRMQKYPKDEIDKRVKAAAEMLQISHLLNRYPKELSGGQRQRVALGRAIVRKPKLFLFDEPLSNLDAKVRTEVRAELKKLHQKLETTIIYVTHDQVEAMTLGDKVVVMRDGVIQQVDKPINIYEKPLNKFVGEFIGSPAMNFVNCTVVKKSTGFYLDEGRFELRLPEIYNHSVESLKEVVLGIRPEDIYDRLYYSGTIDENIFSAIVEIVEPVGNNKLLHVNTGKNIMRVVVDPHNEAEVNHELQLIVNMNKIHLFDVETGVAIQPLT